MQVLIALTFLLGAVTGAGLCAFVRNSPPEIKMLTKTEYKTIRETVPFQGGTYEIPKYHEVDKYSEFIDDETVEDASDTETNHMEKFKRSIASEKKRKKFLRRMKIPGKLWIPKNLQSLLIKTLIYSVQSTLSTATQC